MRHTQAASKKVMIEPINVASQAGRRNPASIHSSVTTGTSATRVRLPRGSISCVNMMPPSLRGAAGEEQMAVGAACSSYSLRCR